MRKLLMENGKIIALFVILFILSVLADLSKDKRFREGVIIRNDLGGEKETYELQLQVDELLQEKDYILEVQPVLPTKEEADSYFEEVIAIIERNFAERKESVPMKKSYLQGKVKAKWSFRPYGIIDSEGNINYEQFEEEKALIQAQVMLTCGTYENIYEFSFWLTRPELSEEEEVLNEIEQDLQTQMQKEGNTKIELPTKIKGKEVLWSEKREYVTPKIFVLELVAGVLFVLTLQRKKREKEAKKREEMEREYPDIVSQLSLLLGAGMTARQAWNRIAAQYSFKKKHQMVQEKPVYEALLQMNRRLVEGESERCAYQEFLEQVPVSCYRKLTRMLLGSLEKGTQEMAARLEEESRLAFEQKIVLAKKRGEEISAKMIFPLLLMLMMVMGLVILPALIEFKM